ncbi:phosphonate ABC transporter ATP-binding protein [Photorhabdus luminescens subsp. luminescens]|uniref:Putative ABC transport system ATP-binding protein n=1 Tax=Photorhabdus luminescens TaxID=29488 RepID=A0A1G5PRZ5_PHOLU|nr:darobactin export ABC transporter ATP-binding protein [Photorhabdus luminescens]KMW74798.1 phosphonate ABC transporter ATP-binding protein [Photorhabdus luminescens subsp. luminescens]MCW7763242.1 darobactin export ABC transporter ATP-binding protein [Photorhabdus luminescens subsp. venezuelensis]OWO82651.1 phosphonate ABC transporter ATP-binding protein [Photorhabdus luminescens]SCZ52364.1 putative ABC transport system ATP-binding protein [Photorhabdus luminescens]
MISMMNVCKSYKTKFIQTNVLNEINLNIDKGEFISIMGASGSGKSTLLNVIGMFEMIDSGQLTLNNSNILTMKYSEKISFRREFIGYIFQSFNLLPNLTVFENIELPLKYRGFSKKQRKSRVFDAISRFGLENRENHKPIQLSGGQQQRVAIARAMISNPAILLADEPTGNLDSVNGQNILSSLKDLNENGTTIVMVTHSKEAAAFSHRILTMKDGHLLI